MKIRRGLRRGITLIETLVATMIITVSMAGAVSLFMTHATLTDRTAEASVATMLARRKIEESRNLGFANLVDGTTTEWYDVNGNNPVASKTGSSRFKVMRAVATDVVVNGAPSDAATRTVTVTVQRASDLKTLETTGSYFVWGGV